MTKRKSRLKTRLGKVLNTPSGYLGGESRSFLQAWQSDTIRALLLAHTMSDRDGWPGKYLAQLANDGYIHKTQLRWSIKKWFRQEACPKQRPDANEQFYFSLGETLLGIAWYAIYDPHLKRWLCDHSCMYGDISTRVIENTKGNIKKHFAKYLPKALECLTENE